MKICSKSRNTALYPLNKEEYGRFSQKNEVLIFRIKKRNRIFASIQKNRRFNVNFSHSHITSPQSNVLP